MVPNDGVAAAVGVEPVPLGALRHAGFPALNTLELLQHLSGHGTVPVDIKVTIVNDTAVAGLNVTARVGRGGSRQGSDSGGHGGDDGDEGSSELHFCWLIED